MRNRKVRFFVLSLFSLWLIITLFFYWHHRVVVKTVTIPGWEQNQDTGVKFKVKEVRLRNKQPLPMGFDQYFSMPIKMIFESNLPYGLKKIVWQIKSFYSLRYEEKWSIQVAGVYLDPSEIEKELSETEFPLNIDLIIDGEISQLGPTGIRSENKKVKFFLVELVDINPNIKSLQVNWEWKERLGTEIVETYFKDHTYNFFELKPFLIDKISPEKEAGNIIRDYLAGQDANVVATQVEVGKKLNWVREQEELSFSTQNIEYLETYAGHKDVFAVTIGFGFQPLDINTRQYEGFQTFYFKEENGKWEVIDISNFIR